MAISATSKTTFAIGTNKAAANVTEYKTDTFTTIGQVEDLGEFGDKSEVINFTAIEDARVRKLKGARDASEMEITVAFDAADAGQTAMRAALASDLPVNFRVVLNDKPTPTGKNSEFYFKGLVTTAANVLGKADEVARMKFTVAITSEVLNVPASAV